jgi:thiosulfate/3-mercaptopyruvate sulfurtransferase
MKSIISPQEAKQFKHAVIIDARAGGPDAHERYLKGHWENALYADLDKDLSKKPENPAFGGRHPLPEIKDFGIVLGKLGIQPSTHVLVYDDKGGGNAAARFWWMMKSIGHEKIQVIDGGLDGLIKEGAIITQKIVQPNQCEAYPVQDWNLPLVDIEIVEQISQGKTNFKIIDVRESFRYKGESEPIDMEVPEYLK